jgi:crotonobetainyl-CoA:carnitine CoA-transferase CaiB-like acyl-CoA transferase
MPEPTGVAGLRVIDISGPEAALCGKLLADLGADVVRFEPAGGSRMRRLPPFGEGRPGDLRSLYQAYFDANKRSCRLDLSVPTDHERLLEFFSRADVLIESHPPDALASVGLGPDTLRERNAGLVIASITPFGQTGPFAQYCGSNLVGWTSGGCITLTGHPEKAPLSPPGTQAYHVASLNAVGAILSALLARRRSGRGAHLDVSVQEAVVSMSETVWSYYLYQGEKILRADGDHPLACPFRVFATRDGHAFIGLSTRGQWEAFVAWLAETDEARELADPKFFELVQRVRNRALVNQIVADWSKNLTTEEVFLGGARREIPTAPTRRFPEILADEQLAARQFFVPVADPPSGRAIQSPGLPYRGHVGPLRTESTPAPRLGADTEAVLREWEDLTPRSPSLRGKGVPTSDASPAPEARVKESDSEGGTPFPRREGGRGVRSDLPLADVKILELCWQMAGPTVARVLGDLGADVIKVEAREIGDGLRMVTPHLHGEVGLGRSGTFHDLNRNKRSITLNLKHPRMREVLDPLVRWADVVTENFTAGTLDRAGIPYPVLREVNPRVVLVSVAGHGQTGPRRTWPCFHPTAAALSGLTGLFAYSGGAPSGFGNSYVDYTPGYVGAIGAIEALLRRERTGEGDHIDVSQVETGVYLMGAEIFAYQVTGEQPQPEGNRAGALGALLQDVFACRAPDTWLAVTVPDAATLAALAGLLGLERTATPEPVRESLAAWLRERDAWEAFETLQRAGIPAGVAEQGPDLIERDPHLKAREMFVYPEHPEMGPAGLPRHPVLFNGRPLPVRRPAPLVGEHNDEILTTIHGFSEERIADLIVNEVI